VGNTNQNSLTYTNKVLHVLQVVLRFVGLLGHWYGLFTHNTPLSFLYRQTRHCLKIHLNVCLSHRLQEQTLSKPSPPTHTHSPLTPTHSPPLPTQSHPVPPTQRKENVDPNVARWIEERDILLQTGVYSNNDSTIQKLDSKIRHAMQAVN